MFEVGFTEILLIMGLALLVLGPEKLPGLAAKLGQWTGRARAMARQLRTQLEQEVTVDDFNKPTARRPVDPVSPTPAQPASSNEPAPPGGSISSHGDASAETPTAGAAQSDGSPIDSTQQTSSQSSPAGEPAAAAPEPARPLAERLDSQTMVSGMEPEPPAAAASAAPAAATRTEPGLDVHSMVSGMEPPAPTPEPATKPEA